MSEEKGVCYYFGKPVGRLSSRACDWCEARDRADLDNGMEAMYGEG